MIKKEFLDPSTLVKGHTILTHTPCLLLRTMIGLAIISGKFHKDWLLLLCLGVISLFGMKYVKYPNVWKDYYRIVFIYSIILFLILLDYGNIIDYQKYRNIIGMLVIIDALFGMTLRHIFNKI